MSLKSEAELQELSDESDIANASNESSGYKSEYEPSKGARRRRPLADRKGAVRSQMSAEERYLLEKWYQRNAYPSRLEYKRLQKELKWPSSMRVAKWFNNRRYNDKAKKAPKVVVSDSEDEA